MLSGEVSLATEDPAALAVADDIERVAGEANSSLGDIVWAIDPLQDSMAGLTERVRDHCERMLKWSHIHYTIDCAHSGPDRSLDPTMKRDIHLLMCEAVNNSIKYARATHINVMFHSDARHVEMTVQDNGTGFDMTKADRKGHGLENMRQRAARVGGHLTILSDRGTMVTLSVCLPA